MGLSAEDKLAIIELVGRYNQAGDIGDGDAWADTFTEDGIFEANQLRVQGREQLRQMALDVTRAIGHIRHSTYNFVIDGEGDEARLQAAFTIMAVAQDRQSVRVIGVGNYDDRLRRVQGQWKFRHRHGRALFWDHPGWP